jgi:hypothetical protein
MEQTPSANTAQATEQTMQAMQATQENLDKVRDILFGAQLRQQDVRWHELEQKLDKQLAGFAEETRKRLESLEGFAKREIGAVLELIKAESAARSDGQNALATQLKEVAAGIEKRIGSIDEQHTTTERALRAELLEQSNLLRDEIAALGKTMTELVEKTAAELRHNKVDRAALAGLFSEMAQRLNG